MENIKEKLINIFTQYSVAEAESHNGKIIKEAFKVADRDELLSREYNEYYEKIKKVKLEIDTIIDTDSEHKKDASFSDKVVSELLKLFKTKHDYDDNYEILSQLIYGGIYNKWDAEQMKKFDRGYDMVCKWKHIFFSYTNTNLPETNNNYADLIKQAIDKEEFKNERNQINLLAKLIAKYLQQHHLTIFYDQDKIKYGDVFKEIIFRQSNSAYAFIQLVEMGIFHEPKADNPNWCFMEFDLFTKWAQETKLYNCKRHFYILIEPDVFPVNLKPLFNDWKENIKRHHDIDYKQMSNINKLKLAIRNLALEILNVRNRIFEDYCTSINT